MGNSSSMCFPAKDFTSQGGFRSSSRKSQARNRMQATTESSTSIPQQDPIPTRRQLPVVDESVETKKIVLIHGEGFGAWCWYKTIFMLEEAGMQPVALDLAGSGIDKTETDSITTIAHYSKPLTDYLERLPENEKVILVGHSCGGVSITYAIESYPEKISKAVFLGATMVATGQRPLDLFAKKLESAKISMQDNGSDKPPTGLMFDMEQIKELYFNRSPPKDIALARALMRPIVLQPMMEELRITAEKYGTVCRFYIQTLEDHVLVPEIQEKLVEENPPHKIFRIKGSDHCPFFSKPQTLHKLLLEIVQLSL